MTTPPGTRRPRRLALLLGPVALVGVLTVGVPAAVGAPAPTPTTSTQAHAAAAQARAAADRATAAAADLDVRLAARRRAVATAVTADLDATAQVQARHRAGTEAAASSTRRTRALYMAGAAGSLRGTAIGAFLAGTDPVAEAQARDIALRSGWRRDLEARTAADQVLDSSREAADRADAEALAQIAGLREVAGTASTLAADLTAAREQATRLQQLGDSLAADERRRAAEALARAEQAAARSQAAAGTAAAAEPVRAVPADYARLYTEAATTCPGMRRQLLSAVGQVESGHGRTVGPSSAGARGPMQFLPATFAAYAVDGDGDGDTDVLDPADAVWTAAKYLCANGAGTGRAGEARALFRYNHADWYVTMVQRIADATP